MKAFKLWLNFFLDQCIRFFCPAKKRLPLKYFLHKIIGYHERELLYLEDICDERKTAVDIGTFVGYYSYRMSKIFSKVISFEINDEVTKDLKSFNPGNIQIIHKGLSSQENEATLYIPVLKGLPLPAWAGLEKEENRYTQKYREKNVSILTLDSFKLSPISFIKVDVEGHEVEVLRGAHHTINRNRPIVMVEIKDQNIQEITGFFLKMGYQRKQLIDLIGKRGSPENFIFLPSDKK